MMIIQTGLRLLEAWSQSGEHMKRATLASHLLELEPENEELSKHLVDATSSLKKREAHGLLSKLERHAQMNGGTVPRVIEQIRSRILN